MNLLFRCLRTTVGTRLQPCAAVIPSVCALALVLSLAPAHAQDARPTCANATECRARIKEAIDARDYESAHDLAWRAVQVGPPRDTELMFLLARTQSLSGRPDDALVMLQRVVQLGGHPDEALTSDDFRRVRTMARWGEVEAAITGKAVDKGETSTTGTPIASNPEAEPTPDPAVPTVQAATPAGLRIAEVLRFNAPGLVPGGLAYDAVSSRFIVGSTQGRKVLAVPEASQRAMDLVRSESAGFQNVNAIDIDTRRGDLWVASSSGFARDGNGHGSGATLHNIQLVSGRPLATFEMRSSDGIVPELTAVSVTPGGTVVALDTAGRRIWRLAPRGRTVEPVVTLDATGLHALAIAGELVAYVSTDQGLLRVDLGTRQARRVHVTGVSAANILAMRWSGDALVAVEVDAASGRGRVLRLRLDRSGTRVAAFEVLEPEVPPLATPPATTISGDDFYYLARAGEGDPGGFVVRRVKLPR